MFNFTVGMIIGSLLTLLPVVVRDRAASRRENERSPLDGREADWAARRKERIGKR